MPRIPSITELELSNLSPRGIDEDFLSRLTACADGSMLDLAEGDLAFEASLRAIRPDNVPAGLYASLEAAISDTPFAVDEKIVLFHKSSRGNTRPVRSWSNRFSIAAAATVALLGSIAAFMVPGSDDGANETISKSNPPVISSSVVNSSVTSNYQPARFNRNLSDTRDEGVIWRGSNSPHRVLRFTYMDRVTLENEKGETVEVEQPKDEFVIIPEKID